jgi:hypothetical protein
MMMLIIVAVLWWTFSVILFTQIVHESAHDSIKSWMETIAMVTLWPLFVPLVTIGMLYEALRVTGEKVRNDLHNRKLLREFEDWLKTRE